MAVEIYADVAKFQALLDSTYPRKFVMFRIVNEYGNIDPNAAANLAIALAMRKAGKLVNFGGYINPGHISNSTMLTKVRDLAFPADAQIMLDVESWPDKDTGVPLISGNHSAGLTALASALRIRQQGRVDLVTAYGNRSQLAELWPTRPAWLGLVIAGYNTNDPRGEYPNLFAWQYTNGVENHTTWPSSSPPFGHCDHNAMFAPIPTPLGDDMTTEEHNALMALGPQISALKTQLLAALASQAQISALHTQLDAAAQTRADDLATLINDVAAKIDALQPGAGGGPLTVALTGTATPSAP